MVRESDLEMLHDFVPAGDHPYVGREVANEPMQFRSARIEQDTILHNAAHVREHLELVVDEVGNAQLIADRCLLVALETEAHTFWAHPCGLEEAMMFHPFDRFARRFIARFGNDIHALTETIMHYAPNGLHGALDLRRPQVPSPEE